MNTIPTIFNGGPASYTAVGGTERRSSTGLSAVILSRGGRYPRYGLFEELGKTGFDYILSIESSFTRYDLEALSLDFPFVRFILLKEAVSPGEEINLAAAELSSPLFFVLWNDLRILRGGGAERMAERLLSSAGTQSQSFDNKGIYKRLCTVPLIQNGRSETMPTLITPALLPEGNHVRQFTNGRTGWAFSPGSAIKAIPLIPRREGLPSLYPFDGIGIYDRERFIRVGGFDSSIQSFHWQLMDFGFRSSLWGEEIAATQLIKLSYEGAIAPEDSTAGEGSHRFFLKNLAPVFRGDYAHIPLRRFFGYYKRKGGDLFAAWEEFSAARDWVKTNRYRFTSDARTIAERWETLDLTGGPEGESERLGPDDPFEKDGASEKDVGSVRGGASGKDGPSGRDVM